MQVLLIGPLSLGLQNRFVTIPCKVYMFQKGVEGGGGGWSKFSLYKEGLGIIMHRENHYYTYYTIPCLI